MITLHILDNFLPQHTAGIEVYVSRLCLEDTTSNSVLIPGHTNSSYQYQGIKVYTIKEDLSFEKSLQDLIRSLCITTIHYHQFEIGKFYSAETLYFLKANGCVLKFTFHLVQYYCSTLSLRQNNNYNCQISINQETCSQCYFRSYYLKKLPKVLQHYNLISKIKFHPRVGQLFDSVNENVSKIISRFFFIVNSFDELITINPDFYDLINQYEEIKPKLVLIKPEKINFIQKENVSDGKLKLVFLGRIEKSKGVEILADLALKLNHSSFEIDLFGQINDTVFDTYYFDNISAKTKTEFRYRGLLKPDEVDAVLINYDYLIHPSQIAEMTPLVIREALKNGIPVIGNDIFGINTYIKHGENGWIFDFNSNNFINEIKKLAGVKFVFFK